MPWRGNQNDAPVAEHIGIAVDELKVLRGAQEPARQRYQLIHVVIRPVGGTYPAILSPLQQDRRVGEQAHVTYVVSVRMRYCDPSDIVWLQPDLGELICQGPIEVIDDQFWQGGPTTRVAVRCFRNARVPKQPFASMPY